MNDTETIVFDQKTIEQIDLYNPQQDGYITEYATGVKFPMYINASSEHTNPELDKTRSIDLATLQDLINISNSEQNQAMDNQSFNDEEAQDIPMLITPKFFKTYVNSLVFDEGKIASEYVSGLMSNEDKIILLNLNNFNLKNSERNITGIKSINSKEENNTYSVGSYAFAIGNDSGAQGQSSYAEGQNNMAYGVAAHAEGSNTKAFANYSHTNGQGTIARGIAQTVIGTYNEEDNNALFIIGNGTADNSRSNALMVTRDGRVVIPNSSNIDNYLVTKQYVDNQIDQIVNNLIENQTYQIGNKMYPVGSIYISLNQNANPVSLFGGQWQKINENRFLLASGGSYTTTGAKGGAATVTLEADQCGIPAHTHGYDLKIQNYTGNVQETTFEDTPNGILTAAFSTRGAYNTQSGAGEILGATNPTYTKNITMTQAISNFSEPVTRYHTSDSSIKTAYQYTISLNAKHTHNIQHKHDLSGNGISKNTAINATSAHNNMPPYIIVHMWKRTKLWQPNN